MKPTHFARGVIALLVAFGPGATALADLTIVQKVEMGSTPGEMTIRIKGDKVRVDPAPQVSMITDNRTGDTVTLMHSEKKAIRMSGEKMKAAAEMVSKFTGATPGAAARPLTSLGRKEEGEWNFNGALFCRYCRGQDDLLTSRLNYPDASAILKENAGLTQPAALTNASDQYASTSAICQASRSRSKWMRKNRHIVMTLDLDQAVIPLPIPIRGAYRLQRDENARDF